MLWPKNEQHVGADDLSNDFSNKGSFGISHVDIVQLCMGQFFWDSRSSLRSSWHASKDVPKSHSYLLVDNYSLDAAKVVSRWTASES
ncbi:hypothetical protein PIB30_077759 [Stylosanthes scabra]|uniref:Uncharacterized protein n=1 Tax=Stylosanthes scabra TaxID=79078 RepID=A0ABU6QQ84_9FABA|nr:hypothetical protein [Stylosanthes scabra]